MQIGFTGQRLTCQAKCECVRKLPPIDETRTSRLAAHSKPGCVVVVVVIVADAAVIQHLRSLLADCCWRLSSRRQRLFEPTC